MQANKEEGTGPSAPAKVLSPKLEAIPKPAPVEDDDDDDDKPLSALARAAVPSKPAGTPQQTALKPAAKPAAAASGSSSPKPAAKPAAPATPSTSSAAKPTSAATPKPAATAAKPAASTPAEKQEGDKIEKKTDTVIEKTTTPAGTKTTTTTTTTAKTHTPTASSKVIVTTTQTTDDSDDDKPLSSLATEKKTTVIKKEKKDDAIVRTEKTTVVKKETKKDDKPVAVKKEVKKETPKKETPKKAPPKKRKAESSESEESSDESSEEEKPKKKPRKKVESDSDEDEKPKKKATPKKKPKKEEDDDEEEKPKKRGKKAKEEEGSDWKWWEEEALPDGRKWNTLIHNGVMFAEPYIPHGVKFYYDGKPVDLTPAAEEVATFYAKYLETEHTKKDIFNKNFWGEFRNYLTSEQKKTVKDFNKADFSKIHKYLVDLKEEKANRTTEQKKEEKDEKAKLIEKYGYAVINGHKQRISNWAIERPGLFLGRGAHPKTGLIKKRIEAEDITINIGKGVPIPEPPPGHQWAKVVHDDKVAWLAMWKENINNGFKYVWLHASSAVKGRSDMKKFEVARKLKGHIEKIRKQYTKELESDELEVRQRSTALYLIDKLALRVGNEKDEETADTVGCCSLRVEHITLKEPTTITLDFLGKDSMRYHNTVEVDKKVFKNLNEFTFKNGNKKSPKKPESDLFDQLTTSSLNKYLKEFMPSLSAKVFRTYNASLTLERELEKMPKDLLKATNDEKVLFYNRCNREVAILCNHQRSLSKTHGDSMAKIDEKIAEFEKKKDKLKQQILYLKGKGKQPVLSDSEDESSTPKKATPKKATPKKAAGKEETPKKRKKGDDEADDFEEDTPKKKVKRGLPDDVDKCKAAIERADISINKWVIKKTEKDELKSVALTTSKINYIDPRITAAWAKKVNLPLEKLFSKSLREKFPWAMDVDQDWEF